MEKHYKEKVIPVSDPIFFTSTSCLLNIKTHICTSRSCPSPNKKVAKKIFTGEETADGSGGSDSGAATSDQNRYLSTFIKLLHVIFL